MFVFYKKNITFAQMLILIYYEFKNMFCKK